MSSRVSFCALVEQALDGGLQQCDLGLELVDALKVCSLSPLVLLAAVTSMLAIPLLLMSVLDVLLPMEVFVDRLLSVRSRLRLTRVLSVPHHHGHLSGHPCPLLALFRLIEELLPLLVVSGQHGLLLDHWRTRRGSP